MTTLRMSASPTLARRLYATLDSRREPVTLIDVGCSGGVEEHWLNFAPALRAIGFDPILPEIERLNASAPASIRYEAAFVGYRDYDELVPYSLRADAVANKNNDSFTRTSAHAHFVLKEGDYAKKNYNQGKELIFTDRRIDLDSFAAASGIRRIDFLKVDTDGSDIEVLLGARELLAAGCLALSLEAQFHGPFHPY